VQTLILFAVSFGTFYGLRALLPGGFMPRDPVEFLTRNARVAKDLKLIYPPLLALGPPALCAWFGWPTAIRVVRLYCIFGALLLVPLLTLSKFEEVRAQMSVWLLLMPVALLGMQRMIEGGSGTRPTSPSRTITEALTRREGGNIRDGGWFY
jgi:hypothetical protein